MSSIKMDIRYILFGIACIIVGIAIMGKYKFYKYSKNDMLFATKIKVFLGGLVLLLLGICTLISEIAKYR